MTSAIHIKEKRLRSTIRNYILFFIFAIVVSGVTVFLLETIMGYMHDHIQIFPAFLRDWITQAYFAVKATNEQYPFLQYGFDWLAFAHLVIALAFIGPLRDPVKNIWIIEWSMISCLCVFPLAFIAGPIRGVPFYWQMIDSSFGVIGFILLFVCYRKIVQLRSIVS